ncbi:MAG: dienelactone hydrolase [Cyanobacteria bacterium P01_A01_bin.84]
MSSNLSENLLVRALFDVAEVENAQFPYNVIHLKILYPARMSGDKQDKNMGTLPVESEQAPFPVIIFFNGFNCDALVYQWLGVKLAECGFVVVTFNWITESFPGAIALTPGVDLAAIEPKNYGKIPSSSALSALLSKLEKLQQESILQGMLDLNKIVLGGHSAGGRVAIENANPQFFPGVVATFAYAAHSMAPMIMGYEAGKILPLPDSLPMLLIGGTVDGVIANSSDRYGLPPGDSTTSLIRTFSEGINGDRKDSYLVLIEGANHFAVAHPCDSTTGRLFLDFPSTQPGDKIRSLITDIISLFLDVHVRHYSEKSQELQNILNSSNPLIHSWKCK